MAKSPGTNSPESSTKKQRSASPSKATPKSACSSSVLAHDELAVLGQQRVRLVVREGAVGLEVAADDLELRQMLQHWREHRAGHPVRRVDHDLQRLDRARCRRRRAPGRRTRARCRGARPCPRRPEPPPGACARSRISSSPDSPPTGQRALADDLQAGVLLRVVRGGDRDAPVQPELADREIDHLRPDKTELEHVGARLRRARDHGPGHRGRGDAHVVPDRDPLRLEDVDEGSPDRARALLVELGAVDPADVVCLEDLRVEHRGDATRARARRARKPAGLRFVHTLEAWNASSPRSCSSISSTRLRSSPAPTPRSCAAVSRRYFERVSRCVTTHGGIVEKFAGDAVMAAFGIPQAHEDDAERAVRAGARDPRLGARARARGAHRDRSRARSSRTTATRPSPPARRSTSPRASSRPRSRARC